jgi:DNA-directed RNA polymerase specialized sigma24 family protein
VTDFDPWDPRSSAWQDRLAFARRVLAGPAYDLTATEREDLAQEALLDLFVRTRSERPRNPEGLLRTIAHRKAMDWFRSRSRWSRLIDGYDPARHEAPDPGLRPEDVLRLRALESLPGIAETWFRTHHPDCLPHAHAYFKDGAWKDLAAEHDARVNTVIKQWERCRKALVTYLRAHGLGWALGDGRDG